MSEVVQRERVEDDKKKNAEIETMWRKNIDLNFQIDFWPYIRSNQTKTCVDIVMENSPMNLEKLLGASHLVYSALALVGISTIQTMI